MFIHAEKDQQQWRLSNSFGHQLLLPCRADFSGRSVPIGVLGTGTRVPPVQRTVNGKRETKAELLAGMLVALQRPLYLLDTRRTGVGGQGSWAPLEFATLIPAGMSAHGHHHAYSYLHLPCLAPSVALLDAAHRDEFPTHRELARRYREELAPETLDIGRAFVEAAATAGGLAVLLCAEPDQPSFSSLAADEQYASYCHRFTLAQQIGGRIREAYRDVQVQLVQLDLIDHGAQKADGRAYVPRTVLL